MNIESNNQQITSTILMVRPKNFGFNPETAINNSFQRASTDLDAISIAGMALKEFDRAVECLRSKGVDIEVFEDTSVPIKTDAVFPNNWITFHESDEVFTFPMYSPNRRKEVRLDILQKLMEKYNIKRIHQLHPLAEEGLFLEGTGSMILDRVNRLVYACKSERTNIQLLHKFCEIAKFSPIEFDATNEEGVPIYHTNVMMALALDFSIICLDCINKEDRKRVVNYLKESNKTIIPITLEQMKHFAGNMLQVKMKNGFPLLVMSKSAYDSLTIDQIEHIKDKTEILTVSIPTIEHFGGGSIRCMLAEIFCHSK